MTIGTQIGFAIGGFAPVVAAAVLRRLRIFGQRDKLKADRSKGA
jgi:hypothetical protein